ncbi:MAG TPA: protease SohB [Polyangiaceae bacterium]|nr:protease SohB [Polyangiaceae bacterium]
MAEFFLEYGLFTAKALTLFVFTGLLLGLAVLLIGGLVARARHQQISSLRVVRVNERIAEQREVLEHALAAPGSEKALHKKQAAEWKKRAEALASARRVFVLDFEGDLQASAVENLRHELTAVLAQATQADEIVVRLESGGGVVHAYGLGASQLERVKARGVRLTVCVDRVAASGGYMMACVADQLIAAPFAVLGSIGVVAQLPNFHRLLRKNDVDFELFTAGQYKRTVTVFGENTDEGRAKMQSDLDDTHALFKQFVREQRPQLDIERVATGEIWLGRRALEEKLVDELATSDEYLARACENAVVLEVKHRRRLPLQGRLVRSLESAVDRSLLRWWDRAQRAPHY